MFDSRPKEIPLHISTTCYVTYTLICVDADAKPVPAVTLEWDSDTLPDIRVHDNTVELEFDPAPEPSTNDRYLITLNDTPILTGYILASATGSPSTNVNKAVTLNVAPPNIYLTVEG